MPKPVKATFATCFALGLANGRERRVRSLERRAALVHDPLSPTNDDRSRVLNKTPELAPTGLGVAVPPTRQPGPHRARHRPTSRQRVDLQGQERMGHSLNGQTGGRRTERPQVSPAAWNSQSSAGAGHLRAGPGGDCVSKPTEPVLESASNRDRLEMHPDAAVFPLDPTRVTSRRKLLAPSKVIEAVRQSA
jgi:hypothetical protein